MNVEVTCDRCKKTVAGLWTDFATSGFYQCAAGHWSNLVNPGESIICDECMHADPRYLAVYGPR